jgi:histidyl-tRNA synthetase
VGWALGVERIVELMHAEGAAVAEPPPDAQLVAAGDAERRFGFKLVEQLRERLPGARIALGAPSAGFKAQLRHADKSGARVALIVGENELTAQKVAFKPLRDGNPQRLVTVEECIELLRQMLAVA